MFSYTGLAYLLGFLALSLLTFRFFQYWRQERNKISKIFFLITVVFSLFMLVVAVGGLFFSNNPSVLKMVEIVSVFIQSFAFALVSYLIIYIKFPQVSPWSGFFIFLLLGFLATFLNTITPFQPYLEESGGINWDVQPAPTIVKTILFLSTLLPMVWITYGQFKNAKDKASKIKSFGILLFFVYGTLITIFDFFFINILKLPAVSNAITMGVRSIIAFLGIFFTQKSPNKKNSNSEDDSFSFSPKIQW
jgi:hypothetical protein